MTIAMITPSTQNLVSKGTSAWRNGSFQVWGRAVQSDFGTVYGARKQRITRRLVGLCYKDVDAGLKETPTG